MAYSNDEFGLTTAQNFITGGDGAKLYNWSVVNTANTSAWDVNTTNAGYMTVACKNNSGMGANYITGPYAYQLVSGNFDVEINWTDNRYRTYEGAGLLVASDNNTNLHIYMINYYSSTPNGIAARSSNGTVESVIGADIAVDNKYFRVSRIGDIFTFYRKANATDLWTQHCQVTRTDLGSSVRIGLFSQTANTYSTYVVQFNYIRFSGPISLYQDKPYSPCVQSGSDGVPVSSVTLDPIENADISISSPIKIGARLASGSGNITLNLSGTNSSLVALALDAGGVPGEWQNYGASLTIPNVAQTNSCFWIKTKGNVTDIEGIDSSVLLSATYNTEIPTTLSISRKCIRPLSILGSAGSYYLGVDHGSSNVWVHNLSGAGDISVFSDVGETFSNITYSNYSSSGSVTTFATSILTTGLTLDTSMTKVREGCYRVTHTFTSSTERWLKLQKYLRSPGSASPWSVGSWFQATGLSVTTGTTPVVGMVAGNGYDNDWCLFNFDYTANTNWYNKDITGNGSYYAYVQYGLLANNASNDYSMYLAAGVPTSYSYVIFSDVISSQADFNRSAYSAYADSYRNGGALSEEEKVLWSTASQLKRLKRHIKVEGSKVLLIVPSQTYAPAISIGDVLFSSIGLGEPETAYACLDLMHRLGPQDGNAANSTLLGSAGNTLDGSCAVYLPWFELYATQVLSYTPDATAQATYLAIADSYADAINNHKILSDTSTYWAHYMSDTFGGPESTGYGSFEQSLTFPQENETRVRWEVFQNTSVNPTRTGADNGVAPFEGSYMLKVPVSGGVGKYAGADSIYITMPAGKQVTFKGWLNIPSAFVSGGAYIQINEYRSDRTLIKYTSSSKQTITTGWQQQTVTVTLDPSTVYIRLRCEADESGTAYFDDCQATLDNPSAGYDGLLWNCAIMPPQLKGDCLSPGVFSMVWAQLNMLSLKVLLGNSWTQNHQTALDLINGSFPNAYWKDANHNVLLDDVYHPIRKTWFSSWVLFSHWLWYELSGSKIFSDAEILAITTTYPKSALGASYGSVAYLGWVASAGGVSVSGTDYTSNWLSDWPYQNGYYINAGGWLWASDVMFHHSRIAAGIANAETDRYKRLMAEVRTSYNSHEALNGVTGAVDAASFNGYGANVIFLGLGIELKTVTTTQSAIARIAILQNGELLLGVNF